MMAQPGMVQPGMAQPGMMGMAQQGMAQPGMMGMAQPGMAQPGMMGMAQPGMAQPGMVQPGMAQPGMVQPGMMPMTSQAPGMMPVVSSAPGMMPVASTAPGMMPMVSQAPGMMPGMMPGQQPGVVPPVSTPGSGAGTPGQAAQIEWAIPQMTRAKYLATFQQTDRARTGFLAGAQARNILLQSGLPQNILAQIWGLSDVDNDGKLSSEEFILAGYLCEQGQKGEPLPATLPANLVPPSMRKGAAQTPTGSAPGVSAASFEDKRKENFNKGQEVLEKRRESLIAEQRKLEEERKQKEKEEAEAKEKQK